jgi:flagellar motor switch protein FliN
VNGESAKTAHGPGLDVLMNVPLQLNAVLGTCRLTVAELLNLGSGSVLGLDRAADAPVDVLINEKVIARGEIVAVDENFGVRITELVRRSA